ncbi:MAG: hypothetical protein ACLFWL_09015 [Candidatus Brocadiia bacterium]
MERGTVRIKPVFVGISHYREIYGSVCSADVEGTPPIPEKDETEVENRASELVDNFTDQLDVDFVEIDPPLVVKEHVDLRRLPGELTRDTDAILVGKLGNTPLITRTLNGYGLPVLGRYPGEAYLRALRVKKYLSESKFLYIGEIPSFSAPSGPYDFPTIEDRLGVRVRHIETNEFFRWFDRFDQKEVEADLKTWSEDFEEVLEPEQNDLLDATRVYLALKGLAEREDANGITVNCGRLTEERPVVPCLAFDRLIDEGIMCACEGDITAMLSSFIIHAVSQKSMLMGNFGSRPGRFEAREGEVTIEHDIIPRSMASTGFTVRDYHERQFGVTGYAPIQEDQPMTLVNTDPALDRISVLEGTIKNSEDGGHCRIIVHMSIEGDVERVPEVIVGSQHVSMSFGHWLAALQETGKLLGMEVQHL